MCVNRVTEKVTFRLEICMGIGMVGIPQNLQEWVHLLWEYRGHGTKTCGNTAGTEFIVVGNPWGVFGKCAIIRFFSLKFLTA